MTEYDRVRLKQTAKQAMRHQRPHPMLVTLLFTLAVSIGSQIISQILGAASGGSTMSALYAQALLRYEDPVAAIQYVMLSLGPQRLAMALFVGVFISGIIVSLWSGLMRTGYAGFCLSMVRGRQPRIEALFSVFPQWAGVLLTQFLAGLFRTLWAVPLGIGLGVVISVSALLFARFEALFLLILLAAYIAFLLCYIRITLRYALVDFLIADRDLTGMDAIRESKRLMQGNHGRLFALVLSFIGWYLLEGAVVLAVCTAGMAGLATLRTGFTVSGGLTDTPLLMMAGPALGFLVLMAAASIAVSVFNLWLTPYITGAEALFYDWAGGADSAPSRGWGVGPAGSPGDVPWER